MTSRLQLISRVAIGGFSTLDHVRERGTGMELVIKRPQPERRRAEAQLQREGEVLAHLQHEHIVALHDAGEDEQGNYLVLEWIDGETLGEIVERAPFVATALPAVLSPFLAGLQALHEAGFAHADVNASNVMLRRDGWVKLIDFGNAWPLVDTGTRTISEANVGSVHHMAPELFAGQPPSVHSDLYAVGIMAWYALTRDYPFDGDTPAQVITAHLHQPCPELPPSPLAEWVRSLLARDPALRPSSVEEALATLPSIS